MLRIGVRNLSNEGHVLLQSDFSLADVVGIRFSPNADKRIYADLIRSGDRCPSTMVLYFTDVPELGVSLQHVTESYQFELFLEKGDGGNA